MLLIGYKKVFIFDVYSQILIHYCQNLMVHSLLLTWWVHLIHSTPLRRIELVYIAGCENLLRHNNHFKDWTKSKDVPLYVQTCKGLFLYYLVSDNYGALFRLVHT